MTGLLAHDGRCVIRTADSDEQVFFALVAGEAGFDTCADNPRQPCLVDRCGHAVRVRVALRHGCVAGFYQLGIRPCTDDVAVLDYLYVHHPMRRIGVGRALFNDLRHAAAARDVGAVRIVAHPAAESFFHRVGAERVGTVHGTAAEPWSRPEFRVLPPAS